MYFCLTAVQKYSQALLSNSVNLLQHIIEKNNVPIIVIKDILHF